MPKNYIIINENIYFIGPYRENYSFTNFIKTSKNTIQTTKRLIIINFRVKAQVRLTDDLKRKLNSYTAVLKINFSE